MSRCAPVIHCFISPWSNNCDLENGQLDGRKRDNCRNSHWIVKSPKVMLVQFSTRLSEVPYNVIQ